jgi:transposase
MAGACSENLRKRFCRALARGMSARYLEVSGSTGVKWAQRRRPAGQGASAAADAATLLSSRLDGAALVLPVA